jgi:hypothetical protein
MNLSLIKMQYLLYMLYFDALPDYYFDSIRQQIWAFLHFPFHLFLVLLVEGIAQFVIWFKMNEAAKYAQITLALGPTHYDC